MKVADRIGIIADDITGGAAIAGEIAREGHVVDVVGLNHAQTPHRSVVIETGSRYIPADDSVRRVRTATRLLRLAGFPVIMKKIDSTLKGNLATELAAFCDASEGRVVIVPACPEVGLTLRDGRQMTPHGAGVDVLALLTTVMPASPALLGLDTVRGGIACVSDWMRRCPNRVVLADAETSEDLDLIIAGATETNVTSFAGTYGLGTALARVLHTARSPLQRPPSIDRMIFIAGSASQTTATQIAHLVRAGAEEIVLDVDGLLLGKGEAEAERIRLRVASSSSRALVIHTSAEETRERVRSHSEKVGWNERDLANILGPPLAAALSVVRESSAVFLIGGETTGAIFTFLEMDGFTVYGECSPAVPIGLTGRVDWPVILTKPGSFGVESVLTDAADAIVPHWRKTSPSFSTLGESRGPT